MVALQWTGGIALGLVALAALVLFGAAVVAVLEQPTLAEAIVGTLIAIVFLVILVGAAIGSWTLITGAMGW